MLCVYILSKKGDLSLFLPPKDRFGCWLPGSTVAGFISKTEIFSFENISVSSKRNHFVLMDERQMQLQPVHENKSIYQCYFRFENNLIITIFMTVVFIRKLNSNIFLGSDEPDWSSGTNILLESKPHQGCKLSTRSI
jgi:hypothetical protein